MSSTSSILTRPAAGYVEAAAPLPSQAESCLDWHALWMGACRRFSESTEADNEAYWDERSATFPATCQRGGYVDDFLTRAGIQPGESVIDMGCGSGTLALPLAADGHHVYACDLSSGMLARLKEQAAGEGVAANIEARKLSWLANWDDLPQADVFLASRSLYSLDMYETFLKMEAHTRRRCCITVGTQGAPGHDPVMRAAIGRPVQQKHEHVYLVNLLFQMGRNPELSYISHVKPVFGDSLEAVRADYERDDGPFTPEESAALDAFLAENFQVVDLSDGTRKVKRSYDRVVRWAFIAWDVPR